MWWLQKNCWDICVFILYDSRKLCFFSRLVATFLLWLMREPVGPCLSVPRLHLNQNWIVNHLSWARFLPLLRALECNCSCSVHNQQPRSWCFCRQPTRELLFLSSHSKVRFFLSAGVYTKASLIGREFAREVCQMEASAKAPFLLQF